MYTNKQFNLKFNMVGKLPSSDISPWTTLPSHEQQQTTALQHQFEQFNLVGKFPSSEISSWTTLPMYSNKWKVNSPVVRYLLGSHSPVMKNNKQMEGKLRSSDISSWITLPSHEQQQTNGR